MPDPDGPSPALAGGRFLTFRAGRQLYALPADEVAEVIRRPPFARVPQGPRGLLGVANLRGVVLPLASLRGLLNQEEAAADAQSRAVVLRGASPVALAVDAVEALVETPAVEPARADFAADAHEQLRGAFRTGANGEVAKVLDIDALLQAALKTRPAARREAAPTAPAAAPEASAEAAERIRLVTFEVAGQEFALRLEDVREIMPPPSAIAAMPRAETVLLGVAGSERELLPILSLRALLGFPVAPPGPQAKVVVVTAGGVAAGLLADGMREILAADPARLEPIPPMLAARTRGESRIEAIYRGDGGRRLVSILSPDQLFREDVMQKLGSQARAAAAPADAQGAGQALKHLVFRLGDEEFALPIEAVVEVARAPEQVTRVPRTPDFLEGVINLRGQVLPVIDQRRRFDMPAFMGGERRLVVVRTARQRAGLLVDQVTEVLRTPASAIEEAPELAGEVNRLVSGVINLRDAGRLVLVLEADELLTRTERGLLDAFAAETAQDVS